MISVRNLTKIYKLSKKKGGQQVVALNSVSIDFPDKGLVFLLGKSGSGKSTLLNAIGGLDTFDSGEIIIKGKSSSNFKQSDFDSYRNTYIGFIFQEYNILEEFSVGKNLSLALELQGKKADKEAVNKLLEQVDLAGYYKRKPNQLSGGQKQRVAIARALIKDPEIIMADEPTGALDSNTGKQVMDTLKKLSKEKLVIIVSHDREFAEIYGDRIVELKDGTIIRDETKNEVEAIKSASGISFIDDKIVHIKKGQQVSKEDMMHIGKMLLEKTRNSDAIISFDEKSNETVKKTAFITDEGNREVFAVTQDKDIVRKQYNPGDCRMIKSKLGFKDAFKMGASSLKHKPIRLIFTILLAVIAFTMFGVINTFSSFNEASSTYETIKSLNLKTLAISNQITYDGGQISDKSYDKIVSDNSGYIFNKVIGAGESSSIEGLSGDTSYDSYTMLPSSTCISGFMAVNTNVKNQFGLELLHGRLPKDNPLPSAEDYEAQRHQNKEICISYNLFKNYMEVYKDIESWEDLNGKLISIYISGNYQYFIIVGVLKDNTDLSKYESLKSKSSSYEDHMKQQESTVVMKYGLANMLYTTENVFNTLYDSYSPENYNYSIFETNDDRYNYGSRMHNIKNLNYEPSYIKSGVNINSLQGAKAIVPKEVLTWKGLEEEDFNSTIENGLTIKIAKDYPLEDNLYLTLDVVGYHSYGGSEVYIAENCYKEYFAGYDYILTSLKGSNEDRKLIEYTYNANSETLNLLVQCPSTPVLSSFGNTIEEISNVLFWVGVGLAAFAGLMLMNFISISISYKKREIGVLRAIGARAKDVFAIFLCESMIICLINFVLSSITTGVVCTIINNSLINDLGITLSLLSFGIVQVLLILAVAVFVGVVSSFFPVYKFAKKNPIDSINNR